MQFISDLKDLPKLPPDGRGIKHKSLAPAKASKATEEEETLDVNDFELVDAKTAAEDLKNIFDAPQVTAELREVCDQLLKSPGSFFRRSGRMGWAN